jgi:hypothetical protein
LAQHQQYADQHTSRPSSSNAASGYSPLSFSNRQQQQQGTYGSPGRYSSMQQQQQQPMMGNQGSQDAKVLAK